MALDPDVIVDRRRIKRRLAMWRFLAVLAVVIAATAIGYAASDAGLPFARKAHVAEIEINGLIGGGQKQVKLLKKIAESKSAKALIVRINSPGGTTAGSEALYEATREVAEKMPVVAVMGTVAASGGYIVALAADQIVARGNTITGSIGVLFQWAEIDEALASLGIKMDEIKSSPLKAEPSLFGGASQEARAITEEMVRDTHEWFLRLVSERRGIDLGRARIVGDGRVYTGRQALDVRLIDRIGGVESAKDWLVEIKGIDETLEVIGWDGESIADLGMPTRITAWIAAALGIDPALTQFGAGLTGTGQRLDGLLSVWHPNLYR